MSDREWRKETIARGGGPAGKNEVEGWVREMKDADNWRSETK